ncbi:hypothetical protein NL676_038927 [Syzygium grande]|nr:hypothetical protein NL676_038927 [Syzygium grande]
MHLGAHQQGRINAKGKQQLQRGLTGAGWVCYRHGAAGIMAGASWDQQRGITTPSPRQEKRQRDPINAFGLIARGVQDARHVERWLGCRGKL